MIGDESDARMSGVERRLSNTLLPLLFEAGAMALNADAALMRHLNPNKVFTMAGKCCEVCISTKNVVVIVI